MSPIAEYRGSCHCSATGFVYRTALAPADWSIRACTCSFCRLHAALSTSDPRGLLEFVEKATGDLGRYRFGQRTGDFLLCRNCGVYLGAVMGSGHQGFGIVNARVLHSLPDRIPDPIPMDYENERADERLARRKERWTPLVIQRT